MAKDDAKAKNLISHQLVHYLEGRGVEQVFGLCGHTNIAVLSAMTNSRLTFINLRREQISAMRPTAMRA